MQTIILIAFGLSSWFWYLLGKKEAEEKIKKDLQNKNDEQILDYIYNTFEL